jgi:hypothetical protein
MHDARTTHMLSLNTKLASLESMLLAITGEHGVDILESMGTDAANAYLAQCLELTVEAKKLAAA